MIINVKYCGGCNPRYERSNVVERLKEHFPKIDIRYEKTDKADVAVIICGCPAVCADVNEYIGAYGRFIIWKESAVKDLFEFLEDIKTKERKSDL